MIRSAYLLHLLLLFQLGILNVQSLPSLLRRHNAMMASRVYTMQRSNNEEWYSKIRQAAIQTEDTQGQCVINYQELLPMQYAVHLDSSDWDALSHQDTFKQYVNSVLKIPENEQNISEVWNFLKIPTVDWYIGYSHLKSLTMEHSTSPIIGPWAPYFVWVSDVKIVSALKRLKSLPISVISKETFGEFVSETLKIPPEEQDNRVWAFIQSLRLHFKFCELYLLLKVAAFRDEGLELRCRGLDFMNIESLRRVHDKEDLRNWGYFSQGRLQWNMTIIDTLNEENRLRELFDLFSLPLLNKLSEFTELASKYVHPDCQDDRVLSYVQKKFNYSSSTISKSVLVSAYNWHSQIKMAAVQTENVPTKIGLYKELLKGPNGFPLPMKSEAAFNEFVTKTLKIPLIEQDSRVWGFILLHQKSTAASRSTTPTLVTSQSTSKSSLSAEPKTKSSDFCDWYSAVKLAISQTERTPEELGNYEELLKTAKGFPVPIQNEVTFNNFVSNTAHIPPYEQDQRAWGFLQKQLYAANHKWYSQVKLAVIQNESMPTDISIVEELSKGPRGKNPPIKTKAAFDNYVLNILKIPPSEQDSRVWGFLNEQFLKSKKTKPSEKATPVSSYPLSNNPTPSYKWYDQVKMAVAQTEMMPTELSNYRELLAGPKSFSLPMKNETVFNRFISNTLKIPESEQDSRVWGFIQNLRNAKPLLQGVVVDTAPLKPPPVLQTEGVLVAASSPPSPPPPSGIIKQTTLVSSLDDINTFKDLMRSIAPREVACDFEGENLGKFGKISLVSIGVAPPSSSKGDVRVFVFDLLHRNPALKQATADLIKEIMEDKAVVKIIHDCRTDRAALYYTMKPRIDLTAVFDTSVWDRELRLLDKLVAGDDTKNRRTLNHVLASYGCAINQARGNIDYQVSTNYWSKRPLTREMVDYAADDVRHLIALKNKMLIRAGVLNADLALLDHRCNFDDSWKASYSIVTPRGVNQARYLNYLEDPEVSLVVSTGPAGCGKTLFACVAAARALESDPLINRIIITRPTVSTSEDLGYLPGNVDSKMAPWVQPIVDNFLKIYSDKSTIDAMISSGKIEISPLGFMRGRTFDNAFIIADEMQNSTPEQMKMFLTRIGMDSKMIITGDLNQSDLGRTSQGPRANGLSDIMERFRVANISEDNESPAKIRLIELGVHDVQRSPVVQKILTMYDN